MSYLKNEIIQLIRDANFETLIGEFESDWLECKRQPYAVDEDEQKLELAKDVAGFANANGGFLLIGLSTKKSPIHGMDQDVRMSFLFPDGYVFSGRFAAGCTNVGVTPNR